MLPNLESLRCFVTAAKTLNFRRAARAMALTPAALGQRIKALEEQLGAPLFQRTTRSVTLTEAGSALLPHAESTLLAAAACAQVGARTHATRSIELVIGTRHELGMSWVMPALRDFERLEPTLATHLYFGSGEDLLARVRGGELDVAIVSTRFDDPRLISLPLHEERYTFVASKRLLARRPFSTAKHAEQHLLLDIASGLPLFRYLAEGAQRRRASTPFAFAGYRYLGTIEAIRTRVLEGAGVAVLPEYYVTPALERGSLVQLLPRLVADTDVFRLVFRRDDVRREVFERLTKFLRNQPLR